MSSNTEQHTTSTFTLSMDDFGMLISGIEKRLCVYIARCITTYFLKHELNRYVYVSINIMDNSHVDFHDAYNYESMKFKTRYAAYVALTYNMYREILDHSTIPLVPNHVLCCESPKAIMECVLRDILPVEEFYEMTKELNRDITIDYKQLVHLSPSRDRVKYNLGDDGKEKYFRHVFSIKNSCDGVNDKLFIPVSESGASYSAYYAGIRTGWCTWAYFNVPITHRLELIVRRKERACLEKERCETGRVRPEIDPVVEWYYRYHPQPNPPPSSPLSVPCETNPPIEIE